MYRSVDSSEEKVFSVILLRLLIIAILFCVLDHGSSQEDDITARQRHLMHGFGSDIDRDLKRVYQRLLGVEIV